jgi:hypothetical protein
VLRKYFFLSGESEECDYNDDPVRLRLVVFQLLQEIKEEKYVLSLNDYCLYAAQFIYLTVSIVVHR